MALVKEADQAEEDMKQSLNNAAVVAVLVATLAFTGMLTPPKCASASGTGAPSPAPGPASLGSEGGTSSSLKAAAAFVYFSAAGFSLSLVAVLLCVLTIPTLKDSMPGEEQPSREQLVKRRWVSIGLLVWVSALCVAGAFLTSAYINFGYDAAGDVDGQWIGSVVITGIILIAGSLLVMTSSLKNLGLS